MVQRVLHDAGYGVVTAENGQRALELLGTLPESVDLVFTDVRMPGMSGPTLARTLSESKPDLPVIYTSGWLEEQDPATSQLPPHSSLLPKPFMPSQLLESVGMALRRARATN
jgi:CheY-like chemotaxis protein